MAYQYSPIGPDDFRLLKLDRPGHSIACELHSFPRAKAPPYYALSYCWGLDAPSSPIFCEGQRLLVTRNLLDGLHQLAQPRWNSLPSASWFWIDALCINQTDDKERAIQVRNMGEIYARASCVLVWLGRAEAMSDAAMDRMHPIVHTFAALSAKVTYAVLEAANLVPLESDQIWDAIFALFNRPYFRRGWMIQEIVLARDIQVLCGDRITPWRTLVQFADDVSKALPSAILLRDPSYEGRNSRTGRGSCTLLQKLRDDATNGHLNTAGCAALLWIAAGKEFTDPRDRVFALLGLLPEHIRSRIYVDYTDQGSSVIAVGRLLLTYIPRLFILSLKQTPHRHADLPSWCPDFRAQQASLNTLSHFDGLSAGVSKSGRSGCAQIVVSDTNEWIGIKGFPLDTVQTVATLKLPEVVDVNTRSLHPDFPSAILRWERHCRAIFQDTRRPGWETEAESLERYARTLVVEHFGFNHAIPASVDTYTRLAGFMRAFATLAADSRPREYESAAAGGDLSQYMSGLEGQYARRFFNTQSGRIGMGPDDLQARDLICVFYSGFPLYVLRWHEESASHKYVGEAYVHGCMDLDDLADRENQRDQMFWIS